MSPLMWALGLMWLPLVSSPKKISPSHVQKTGRQRRSSSSLNLWQIFFHCFPSASCFGRRCCAPACHPAGLWHYLLAFFCSVNTGKSCDDSIVHLRQWESKSRSRLQCCLLKIVGFLKMQALLVDMYWPRFTWTPATYITDGRLSKLLEDAVRSDLVT